MNKVILMGRLTRDPEAKYSAGPEPIAVVKFTVAVNRRFKRAGEADADFINCTAFGKNGEFIKQYFKKGMMISLAGRLQVSSWEDKNNNGQKRWSTDVIVEEQYFAESKASSEAYRQSQPVENNAEDFNKPQQSFSDSQPDGFYHVEESVEDEDLPF